MKLVQEREQALGGAAEPGGTLQDGWEYTGRYFDFVTGLQHNRARWLHAGTGRFLGEDPLGFSAGDVNLYRYAGNSTPNATDPSGHFIQTLIGAAVGAAVGVVTQVVTDAVNGELSSLGTYVGAAAGGAVGGR